MGVIFITEKDYYQAGKAVYMIQNMNQTLDQPFGDGAHILYVNKVSQGKFEGSERDVPDNG